MKKNSLLAKAQTVTIPTEYDLTLDDLQELRDLAGAVIDPNGLFKVISAAHKIGFLHGRRFVVNRVKKL